MANLTQTTLSGAITAAATTIRVASATGISAPTNGVAQELYIIDPDGIVGELMSVQSVSGTTVTVSRLYQFKSAHANGSIVVIGTNSSLDMSFFGTNPSGVIAAADVPSVPYINVVTGQQWLRGLSGVWVSGWNNPSSIKGVTAAVASAAGAITPSGPLFHVTGTAAVTGFTIPVGFSGGSFTIIPDGAFTWTTAGNIAVAGTAVVNRALTFTWDSNAGKFNPSYV